MDILQNVSNTVQHLETNVKEGMEWAEIIGLTLFGLLLCWIFMLICRMLKCIKCICLDPCCFGYRRLHNQV